MTRERIDSYEKTTEVGPYKQTSLYFMKKHLGKIQTELSSVYLRVYKDVS